jgi:argininosuccinate lyase
MLPEIKVNKQKMAEAAQSGFLTATDLADYLAGKGVPFRTAHEVVGSIVSYCVREKKTFRDLSFNELKRFSTDFKRDALNCLTIESSVNSRKCIGGTGKQSVKRAITKAKTELRKGEKFIEKNKFRN